MIVFDTPTELDLLALRTFGISAKETDSPIGRFGTGLKYALAVLVREGCEVTINAGNVQLTVEAETRDFRGKEFQFVVGRPQSEPAFDLGFTTELGKDWELWQAFRELYSNTLDESGDTARLTTLPMARAGRSTISVIGAGFEQVYDERNSIVITDEPLWENDDVAIHAGPSKHMFYQGIRARELEHPAAYRYNIKKYIELTEDRTIKYDFYADSIIRDAIAVCDNEEIIARALTGGQKTAERRFDYAEADEHSAAFARTVISERAKKESSVPASAVMAVAKPMNTDSIESTPGVALDDEQQARLYRVAELLKLADIDITKRSIIAVGMLPGNVDSSAKGGRIYLATGAFKSDEHLRQCLVEEMAALELFGSDRWMKDRLLAALSALSSNGEES